MPDIDLCKDVLVNGTMLGEEASDSTRFKSFLNFTMNIYQSYKSSSSNSSINANYNPETYAGEFGYDKSRQGVENMMSDIRTLLRTEEYTSHRIYKNYKKVATEIIDAWLSCMNKKEKGLRVSVEFTENPLYFNVVAQYNPDNLVGSYPKVYFLDIKVPGNIEILDGWFWDTKGRAKKDQGSYVTVNRKTQSFKRKDDDPVFFQVRSTNGEGKVDLGSINEFTTENECMEANWNGNYLPLDGGAADADSYYFDLHVAPDASKDRCMRVETSVSAIAHLEGDKTAWTRIYDGDKQIWSSKPFSFTERGGGPGTYYFFLRKGQARKFTVKGIVTANAKLISVNAQIHQKV